MWHLYTKLWERLDFQSISDKKALECFCVSSLWRIKRKNGHEKNRVPLTKSLLKQWIFVMVPEKVKEFMFFRKLSVTDDTLGLFACEWVDAMLTSLIHFRKILCCCQVPDCNGIWQRAGQHHNNVVVEKCPGTANSPRNYLEQWAFSLL